MNLGKALSKNEQKEVNGGRGDSRCSGNNHWDECTKDCISNNEQYFPAC